MSKFFDPLGLISPFILNGKLILQEIWTLPLEWDAPVPEEISKKYKIFLEEAKQINEISVPRFLFMQEMADREIHVFSDASEKAYAAAVYLRSIYKDQVYCTLISAKTKVAPLKTISVPRLELQAAVLASKLAKRVATILQIPTGKCFAWFDSTITLSWLSKSPSEWKCFIANRVTAIQENIPSHQWRHVKGQENPADLASRNCNIKNLIESNIWWKGPKWLRENVIPQASSWKFNEKAKYEERRIQATTLPTVMVEPFLINKTSSFQFLINVTGLCLRFINNLKMKIKPTKSDRSVQPVTEAEFQNAVNHWVLIVQGQHFASEIDQLRKKRPIPVQSRLRSLTPFLDENQILRVGGRLKQANWDFERSHPMILPKGHRFTELVIFYYHKISMHAPVETLLSIMRQKFWIIDARSTIKKTLRTCLNCAKQKLKCMQQIMGDLPPSRVTPARTFERVGIDYAGPIPIKASKLRNSKTTIKAYIAIFICMVTKAVHIELVTDLTHQAFIAALKRFTARRGYPLHIYSDNGTTFVAANKMLGKDFKEFIQSQELNQEIQGYLVPRQVTWHFHPPTAAHFGGLWESNIKVIKKSISKVVGETKLTFEELYTLLTQVEANMNSRPLKAVSTDSEDLECLTPGHFLIGGPLMALPEPTTENSGLSLKSRWHLVKQLNEHIWQRWQKEYVAQMQQRKKWREAQENIKVGKIVMVANSNPLANQWSLGRIVDVHPGGDDIVRVVTVKIGDQKFVRPITKIAVLPSI